MTKREAIRLISEIISGTQVPRSMGMLGAAQAPWDKIREELKIFGYRNPEEYERELLKVFGLKETVSLRD